MNDKIRDQLWADTYAAERAADRFAGNPAHEADMAVKAYDARHAAAPAQPDTSLDACEWRLDEFDERWESSCGESWSFIDGGPKENNIRFCHGCGKPTAIAAQGDKS